MSRLRTIFAAAILTVAALTAPAGAVAGPPDDSGIVNHAQSWTWRG